MLMATLGDMSEGKENRSLPVAVAYQRADLEPSSIAVTKLLRVAEIGAASIALLMEEALRRM